MTKPLDHAKVLLLEQYDIPAPLHHDNRGAYLAAWLAAQRNGRAPTVSTMAESVGLTPAAIRKMRQRSAVFGRAEAAVRAGKRFGDPSLGKEPDPEPEPEPRKSALLERWERAQAALNALPPGPPFRGTTQTRAWAEGSYDQNREALIAIQAEAKKRGADLPVLVPPPREIPRVRMRRTDVPDWVR